jgi:predicted GNAT superfamily acetyltransferase
MPEQKAAPAELEIRMCSDFSDYQQCVRIQELVWGRELVVGTSMFVVAQDTGGQVIGAFDGKTIVGFTMAVAGVRAGKPFLHSHMTAVLDGYRDRGVGRRLKLFQRQEALKRGIGLVEWTFDPLELKNAYFNFVRLGAVARRLIPNCYGVTDSPLHAGLPTDRLVAEWWLDSERVTNILADSPLPARGPVARISLPTNLGQVKSADRDAGARIQNTVREQFQKYFRSGCVATAVEARGNNTDYILEPIAAVTGLKLPDIPGH